MSAENQVITITYLISIWPYRPSFLDFPALPEFNPRVHRKDVLFDPPPGPGGRRPTPDSAMRPRARKCLDRHTPPSGSPEGETRWRVMTGGKWRERLRRQR